MASSKNFLSTWLTEARRDQALLDAGKITEHEFWSRVHERDSVYADLTPAERDQLNALAKWH